MLVNATDLDVWAGTRDAEGRLPMLVRRFIFASTDPVDELEFRAGEGVVLPGWDGLVTAPEGSTYVPAGTSRWELSTSDDLPNKAQRDYTKRTADPLGALPANSTFVFVTPRRWRNKDEWVERRRSEQVWKDVRVFDADSLEGWLEQARAVHIWISRQLGRQPPDAIDLETHWDEWSGVTNPPINVALVIAGRQPESTRVFDWLGGPPSLLSLQAETEEEAIAFLAACVQSLPSDDRDRLFARSALIKSEDSWREVSYAAAPLVLIPQLPDRQGVPTAVTRGHHVLVPLARNHPTDQTTIALPAVDREAAKAVLGDLGFDEDPAVELAGLAWRGLAILRRRIAVSPALMVPLWAQLPTGRELLPAILAGHWDESKDADRAVLAHMSQDTYHSLRERLMTSAAQPDAPVRRIGQKWLTVARADSWSLLASLLTQAELELFREMALRVFREEDPKFDLPPNERYAAAVHGKVLTHSTDLRDGMAETVALLGAFEGIDGAMTGAQWAAWLVRDVLADADWKLWASLTHQLNMFAEASPSDFMDAVERDLADGGQVITDLFTEDEELFTSSPSVGLLWALEVLAWSQEHLPRATMLLARIDDAMRPEE